MIGWRTILKTMQVNIVLVMTLVFCGVSAKAQSPIQITSPTPGTIVHRGSTLEVTFTADPSVTNFIFAGGFKKGLAAPLSGANAFSVPIPSTAQIKGYQIYVLGVQNGQLIASDAVPIQIDSALTIVTISSNTQRLILRSLGDVLPLLVRGTFADGSSAYVNGSTQITFVSQNPSIATVDTNGNVSAVSAGATAIVVSGASSGVYTVPVVVAAAPASAPVLSPAPGTFAGAQSVTISDTAPGAMLYYTMDGSPPTTKSNRYSGPIALTATTTLNALAVVPGAGRSVTWGKYTIQPVAPAPMFSPTAGSFPVTQSVTISDVLAGVTIYYTTNGSTPTTSSTLYTGPITVSTSQTVQAIAVANGYATSPVASAAYTINISITAAAPIFTPAPGTFTAAQTVAISDSTTGATIYYTTNGSTPTTSSNLYTGPITVSSSQTIQAIAVASGYTPSPIASATYTISSPMAAATPIFSPVAGMFNAAPMVSITDATAGAAIYYTTNGMAPTTSSTLYTGPITISSSQTVQAIAVASGYTSSPIASATYTINLPIAAATPTFSPAPGTFTAAQTVAISDATAGASIYYTTNGTAPTTSSALYSGPIAVSSSQTIEAISIASGYTTSPVASATYTINLPSLPLDFSLGLSNTSLVVMGGQSGTMTASITPGNGFNQSVSFTCSGLPSGSACSFSPAMLTPNGTAVGTTTVTVTTAAKTSLLEKNRPYELAGLLAGLGLWFAGRRFRRLGRLGALLLMTVGLGSFVSGCGTNPITQSEPTTSVVSINAVSGSLTHTASFSLTVK